MLAWPKTFLPLPDPCQTSSPSGRSTTVGMASMRRFRVLRATSAANTTNKHCPAKAYPTGSSKSSMAAGRFVLGRCELLMLPTRSRPSCIKPRRSPACRMATSDTLPRRPAGTGKVEPGLSAFQEAGPPPLQERRGAAPAAPRRCPRALDAAAASASLVAGSVFYCGRSGSAAPGQAARLAACPVMQPRIACR